jgi:biotin carboxylase
VDHRERFGDRIGDIRARHPQLDSQVGAVWADTNPRNEVYHGILSIKKGFGAAIRVTASHADSDSPYRLAADDFVIEPRGLDRLNYAAWFHWQARQLGATLVWPQHNAASILSTPFPLAMRAIAAADSVTLQTLSDKALTYAACSGTTIPIPSHRVASTSGALRTALDELGAESAAVCIKPLTSTYGHGFRKVVHHADPLHLLLTNATDLVSRDHLLATYSASTSPPPLLVMPYLTGPEFSIDCLASNGRLLRHVARRKQADTRLQLLTTSSALRRIAEAVTAHFNLNAVFNLQLREHEGVLFLLEINARMSGGLAITSFSGLSFPEWAVRLATGASPTEIPMPRYDLRVATIDVPILHSVRVP